MTRIDDIPSRQISKQIFAQTTSLAKALGSRYINMTFMFQAVATMFHALEAKMADFISDSTALKIWVVAYTIASASHFAFSA